MLVSLRRIATSGWEKFTRDRSSTSAATVVMLIVMFLVTSLVFLQGFSSYVIDSIEERIAISTYFKESVSEQEILDARTEIARLPQVKEVEYISREEALESFRERHRGDEIVEQSLSAVGENPLLASLSIKAATPESYQEVAQILQQSSFAPLINTVDYQNRAPVIERIASLSSAIRAGMLAVSIILGVIAVLVAFNTVRLTIYNSREEIEIMRLVGASNWFIRGPFILQGILSGLAATFITMLLLFPVSFFASSRVEAIAPGFSLWGYFLENFFVILALQLLVGIGLGVLSSIIAIRRYLAV